jgi:hypothetical protein
MLAAVVAATLLAPPTPAEPIVVADRRVAATELEERAKRMNVDSRRAQPLFFRFNAGPERAADEAAEQRWIEGEAAFRHLTADPRMVDAAVAREQRTWGGKARWRKALAPETPEQARARVANDVLRMTIGRDIAVHARDAKAFGLAFDDFHARWRAVTACQDGSRMAREDRCGNFPEPNDACVWMGEAEVCRIGPEWAILHDLSAAFYPRRDELTGLDALDAVDKLERELRRTAPATARRIDFDNEADEQVVYGRRRADLIVAARAIQRLTWRAQRSAAGQAIR